VTQALRRGLATAEELRAQARDRGRRAAALVERALARPPRGAARAAP
jgi:hypothetical protein